MIVLDGEEVRRYRRLVGLKRHRVEVLKGNLPPTLVGYLRGRISNMDDPFVLSRVAVRDGPTELPVDGRTLHTVVGAQWVWLDRLRRRVGLTEDAPEYAILDRAREMGLLSDS